MKMGNSEHEEKLAELIKKPKRESVTSIHALLHDAYQFRCAHYPRSCKSCKIPVILVVIRAQTMRRLSRRRKPSQSWQILWKVWRPRLVELRLISVKSGITKWQLWLRQSSVRTCHIWGNVMISMCSWLLSPPADEAREMLLSAIYTLSEALKCFQFYVTRKGVTLPSRKDHLVISRDRDGCLSMLGKQSGQQVGISSTHVYLIVSCYNRMRY